MPRVSRSTRIAIVAFIALSIIFFLRNSSQGPSRHESVLLQSRRDEIEAAFEHAWRGYATHCMGHDFLHPVSNTCDDTLGGWAATAIDALSTAIVMQKKDIVLQILHFIPSLNFRSVKGGDSVNVYEVNIRHLGGMLSAWDLLNGPFKEMIEDPWLLQVLSTKIAVLGEALACAFDTPSGIPRNWVDPSGCHSTKNTSDHGASNALAGVGTLVLEFSKLSQVTGKTKYAQLAQRAENHLIAPWPAFGESFPGLLGSFINVRDGSLLDRKGGWGPLAGSFYEYLLKAYIYDPKLFRPYLARWQLAADSTIQHLASHPYGHPHWTLLPSFEGTKKTYTMDASSWFAGGDFILGGMVTRNRTLTEFGLSIADTGGALYGMTATGLGGDTVQWSETCHTMSGKEICTAEDSVQLPSTEFNLRPELIETWYYAYRATRKSKYREWGWSAFQAIQTFCKTDSGFSAISDVTDVDGGEKLDKQESFLFARFFKYLYLLHSEDAAEYQVQNSRAGMHNTWVFNTKGHPLKVAGDPV